METRKVQKVGTSTLTVSLPKEWATKRNLRKGDQVFLEEDGDGLRIVPAAAIEARRREPEEYIVDADLCDVPGLLERIIVGSYVLGRERVVVRSRRRLSSEHLAEVQRTSRRLMGLGIIEETATRITLQTSIEPTKYPIETLLKRLYSLGSTMLDEAIEALVTRDKGLAEDAIRREDDADMMYWLIVRLLLGAQADDAIAEKLGIEDRLWIAGYRLIAKELESVADHGEDIAATVLRLLEKDREVSTAVIQALTDLAEGVRETYSKGIAALLSRDLKLANEAIRLRETFDARRETFQRMLFKEVEDAETLVGFNRIFHGIERMHEYALSIAVIAMNRYLERPSNISHPAR
jgi:phosphate uptake regulator